MLGYCLRTIAYYSAIVLVCGCGSSKPSPTQILEVEGSVLLDGEPLRKVRVSFVPKGDYGPEYIAVGTTDESGRFTLSCHGQPGACIGENTVLITESELPPHLKGERGRQDKIKYFESLGGRPLPERFGSLAADNPIIVTVSADRKIYAVALTR